MDNLLTKCSSFTSLKVNHVKFGSGAYSSKLLSLEVKVAASGTLKGLHWRLSNITWLAWIKAGHS
eukprot:1160848-Pelagomonas_calceolata.AAC.1